MLRQAVADPEEGHGAMALSGAPARVTFWFSRSSFAQNIFSPKGHRTLKKVNFRDFFQGFLLAHRGPESNWSLSGANPGSPTGGRHASVSVFTVTFSLVRVK